MLSVKNLVMDTQRISNRIAIDLTNSNNKIELYEDSLTPEYHIDVNIYINDSFKESMIINISDHDKLTVILETIINNIDSNLNNWSYEVVRESDYLNGKINAVKNERGLYFTNIWGDKDLLPKCNRIASNETLTNLMVLNKEYNMNVLLILAEDNNISKYVINAIEYLRTA